ncbi:hypothetical protein MBLNU457_6831t2 [Dothideomycetes sp. NU457]
MSKLSPSLKSLINAPFARPGAVSAPKNIKSVYESIAKEAEAKNVGVPAWLSIATGTTMTMNSPESLQSLYTVASSHQSPVTTAEFMREIGLKCIGFNGVPRTINMLGAFRASLPADVVSSLSTTPTREPNPDNITAMSKRGRDLWDSIYRPFHDKLYAKLGDSHPDLPVHILHSEYGALFADPPNREPKEFQTGVGPQVLSHVFGLRKAYEDGTAEGEDVVKGGKWLAGDEGSTWLLETVDRIVQAIGQGEGTTFAPTKRESKL